jgi:hypothetical protein
MVSGGSIQKKIFIYNFEYRNSTIAAIASGHVIVHFFIRSAVDFF